MHDHGARRFAAQNGLTPAPLPFGEAPSRGRENLSEWLEQIENEAWLVPERGTVAGEAAVSAFLADEARAPQYQALFGGLCLSISALAAAWGVDWRQWVFQTINVAYRSPEFGLTEMAAWLKPLAANGR
jgi:hypothetical protein